MTFNNIVVVVPANVVSGGPEALHHLVQEMNSAGLNASICYFPFDQKFKPPERYAKFNTPVIRFEDCASTLYIFPEVMPMEALRIKKGRAIIWWLSLDNYYERRPDVSLLRNVARYIKRRYKGARPMRGISALRNLGHWTQSHYAHLYLTSRGFQCIELFEPINPEYRDISCIESRKYAAENIVLYNPVKGIKLTKQIIDANPNIDFVPLQGFSQAEMVYQFQRAKLYLDLGHHPGRDRMPREAALLGCCVVTSKKGSAGNSIDVPLPEHYKIDTTQPDFVHTTSFVIHSILENHSIHFEAQREFRNHIDFEFDRYRKNIIKALAHAEQLWNVK